MRRAIDVAGTVLDCDAITGIGPVLPALPAFNKDWGSDKAYLAPGFKVFGNGSPIIINATSLEDAEALRDWLINRLFHVIGTVPQVGSTTASIEPQPSLKQQAIDALNRELNWDGPNKVTILKALNTLSDS